MTGTRAQRLAAVIAALTVLAGCTGAEPIDDVFALEIGDCLADGDVTGQVTTVPLVDCADPHDSEVFARTDADGTAFPGDDVLETRLAAYCQGDAFTDFVGIPYLDSVYTTSGYFPTPASWANGDRELLCTIADPSGPTTGSLAGTRR